MLACSKPKNLGYAAELWTRSALARPVRTHEVEACRPSLAEAAKAAAGVSTFPTENVLACAADSSGAPALK